MPENCPNDFIFAHQLDIDKTNISCEFGEISIILTSNYDVISIFVDFLAIIFDRAAKSADYACRLVAKFDILTFTHLIQLFTHLIQLFRPLI